jgi:hypothetical protein
MSSEEISLHYFAPGIPRKSGGPETTWETVELFENMDLAGRTQIV